jgi:hypothetical protein
MRLMFLLIVAAGCIFGCLPAERHYTIDYYQHTAAESSARPRTVGVGTLVDRTIVECAGTSGTCTVATGHYVTKCSFFGTAASTLTATPCGPAVATCTAQPAITAPAGVAYTWTPPGAPNSVADGSTLVFASTTNYACEGIVYSP